MLAVEGEQITKRSPSKAKLLHQVPIQLLWKRGHNRSLLPEQEKVSAKEHYLWANLKADTIEPHPWRNSSSNSRDNVHYLHRHLIKTGYSAAHVKVGHIKNVLE
jgi:hypothetical protein